MKDRRFHLLILDEANRLIHQLAVYRDIKAKLQVKLNCSKYFIHDQLYIYWKNIISLFCLRFLDMIRIL